MEFQALNALQGDAFIIREGNTSILIDAGMPSTYGQIEQWLEEYSLSAAFVTHVDYDHLGGMFNWFTDPDSDVSLCDFYMNHPEIPTEYQGEEVGFKHGHSLKELLARKGQCFQELTTGQQLTYGELNILTLAPDETIIEALYQNWESNIFFDDGVLKYKKNQTQFGDIINKSSLILLISCNDKKILMLGDSHSGCALLSLQKNNYSIQNPLLLDLVKVSHHGSKHNTSEELLSLIECSNYFISTNGGRYDHPDAETILLLQNRAAELNTLFNVYLNYDIESEIRHRCDFPIDNLIFIEQCSVTIV